MRGGILDVLQVEVLGDAAIEAVCQGINCRAEKDTAENSIANMILLFR